MINNNYDKEIIKELQNITKDNEELNKTRKRIKVAMYAILVCNFLAGCFIGSIYFIINDVMYLFIGIILILLDIPAYKILNNIIQKIKQNNFN